MLEVMKEVKLILSKVPDQEFIRAVRGTASRG
jgi:hypothetical protein